MTRQGGAPTRTGSPSRVPYSELSSVPESARCPFKAAATLTSLLIQDSTASVASAQTVDVLPLCCVILAIGISPGRFRL